MPMEARILRGAQYAYVAITDEGIALDVRLEGGRSATTSLIETANDLREKAERLVNRARIIEQAAAQLS